MLLIFPLTVSQRLLIKKSEIWKPQLNFDIFFHCIVFGQIFVNVDDTAQYVAKPLKRKINVIILQFCKVIISNQPKSQLSLVHRKAFFLESQLSVSVYTYETICRSKKENNKQ